MTVCAGRVQQARGILYQKLFYKLDAVGSLLRSFLDKTYDESIFAVLVNTMFDSFWGPLNPSTSFITRTPTLSLWRSASSLLALPRLSLPQSEENDTSSSQVSG